ncbi:hypothetical protein TraAM80_07577 [Trypanosoma rangeli]|uniref:Biogenesis of lysosome-related organelles complex 1 subunit 2 n=1 Tax=Trypanosoma rangeli TaxID=5698 RepID=A0A3R7KSF8_TRYRA|nr:uncharacterized protein TraAM80_07577 [Trypanosoma rangeli]RNF00468.1 hypothetical protein TraAM80_07577 [Trypanosoma rangeli]|eukprot:RNF00468.1 hypothetical protein TraAM80_07577 [Trypanosoma rangeli]
MQEPSDSMGSKDLHGFFTSGCVPGLDGASFASPVAGETGVLDQLRHAHAAVQQYVAAEMGTYTEDWKLLGRCTEVLEGRYQEVRDSTKEAVRELGTTAEVMERLLPQLADVDKVEAQLATLTEVVNRIDEYSKALADRFECN